ncbi:MAG TPA: choice-of-anchor D domain-containing protein [Acidobacteriaceae bacterium]
MILAGCGSSGPGVPTHTPAGNSRYTGAVHGGQQPVAGASIQLYTVGTTADGSAATPLLTSTVTSDASGNFTITGLYSCASATQVYIVATGGNPGLSTTNPNIALMAALGPCSSLTPQTFINIDEVTTVAAVVALAPYMSPTSPMTSIGSGSSDASSLANAFTLASQLADTTTGTSPGNAPTGDTVPTAEINTLADILSACINSTGGTAGDSSLCGQLFSLTTIQPIPAPTDTIAAMLNVANNPTLNTGSLYSLAPPTPPFQPTLTSAPADFSVSLQSPAGQPDQSAINFQNVTVGSSSPIQTINLPSYNSSIIIGANPTDFSVGDFSPTYVGSCGYGGVASSGPCWIQVYAHPSAPGLRTASIEIDYNNGLSTFYIPLSVTAIASTPNSSLSNSYINFSPTITGASSSAVPVTLNNSGPGTLTVSAVAINGVADNNFTQTNNCSSVAVNASCTIYVTFNATRSGSQTATLQVTSTESGSNTVSLSGIGLAPGTAPSLWPSSLTYTIWGANEDLILTNPGTSSISATVGAGTTGGLSDAHTYYEQMNGCGSTLASGASCTFTVENVPTDPLSTYTAGFSNVTGDAFVTSDSTSLTSDIITENDAYLTQNGGFNGPGTGTITFPSEPVGASETATIQLANIGSGSPAASLAIGGANPGDFTVSAVQPTVSSTPSSFCPAVSSGTQPCTITVTFTPTASGTRSAKISLDANGSSTGQYIYVTGTAQ